MFTKIELPNEKPFYVETKNVEKFKARLLASRQPFFNKITATKNHE